MAHEFGSFRWFRWFLSLGKKISLSDPDLVQADNSRERMGVGNIITFLWLSFSFLSFNFTVRHCTTFYF